MNNEEKAFTRELRYIVVKYSDAVKYLSTQERTAMETITARCQLGRIDAGKKLLECVVIESDWPEYEPTWKAIEERMQPTAPTPAGGETPRTDELCNQPVYTPTDADADVIFLASGKGTEKERRAALAAMMARDRTARRFWIDRCKETNADLTAARHQAEHDRERITVLNIQNTEWAHKITGLRSQCDLLQKEVCELHERLNEAWNRSSAFAAQFRQKDKTLVCDPASAASVIITLRTQLAQADADRERLDWLEVAGNAAFMHTIGAPENPPLGRVVRVGLRSLVKYYDGKTYRECIDAALSAVDQGEAGKGQQ